MSHHRVERLLRSWISAGQPLDHGTIDLSVFVAKGEAPGHAELLDVDPAKIWAMQGEAMRNGIRDAIKQVQK